MLPIKALVENLEFSGSKVSRILDQLEDQRLLRREINAEDRRSILVHLTSKGERLLGSMSEQLHRAYAPALAGIQADQISKALQVEEIILARLAGRAGKPKVAHRPQTDGREELR